jgi:hypothetical protein
MKDLWTTLPLDNPIRKRVERVLGSDMPEADAWRSVAGICWPAGYDLAAPPHTFSDKLVALRKSDPQAAGRLMQERSAELASERAAARCYAGRRAWAAAGPPQHQIEAQRAASKKAAELESAVGERTREILAGEAMKREAAARARAVKEMEN